MMANMPSIKNTTSFTLGGAKKGGKGVKDCFWQAYQGNTLVKRFFYAGLCQ